MSLPADAKARKNLPIARGVLDYFPDAIAAVAEVSRLGNEQHNPGQPLHWAREKSTDHADCIARHLIERGMIDVDGARHSAKLAWRALALLQTELEDDADRGQPFPMTAADIQASKRLLEFRRRRAGGVGVVDHHDAVGHVVKHAIVFQEEPAT